MTFPDFTENSVACTSADIVYDMSLASSDPSVDPTGYITFDPSTRTVSWYWDIVPLAATFTVTITGRITTDTNNQAALVDTSPRGQAYLVHRLKGY